MMTKDSLRKGIISEFYSLLTSGSSESSQFKLFAWKEDLQSEISDEVWRTACANAQSKSVNTRLKLIQYKWLMRLYVTPVDLNRYNENIPDVCTKCMEHRGTWFHCIWQCTKIKKFWEEVRATIEKIISKQISLDPKLFLLGLYPEIHNYSKNERVFIDLSSLYAKKCIAQLWKNTHRPNIAQWMRQMLSNLPLERITYILKTKQHIFESVWGPFINYVKNFDLTDDQDD